MTAATQRGCLLLVAVVEVLRVNTRPLWGVSTYAGLRSFERTVAAIDSLCERLRETGAAGLIRAPRDRDGDGVTVRCWYVVPVTSIVREGETIDDVDLPRQLGHTLGYTVLVPYSRTYLYPSWDALRDGFQLLPDAWLHAILRREKRQRRSR